MSLQSAKDEFFKLVNDLQHTGQSKKTDSHSSKNFSVDNYTLSESFRVRDVFYFISVKRFSYPVSLQDCPIAPAGQPPEMC
ncbi:MAG: hypothetical protein JST13_04845 [Bacteroidetes bacterium]|nr:hypothetical protein [Bacteroidota bacterium]